MQRPCERELGVLKGLKQSQSSWRCKVEIIHVLIGHDKAMLRSELL